MYSEEEARKYEDDLIDIKSNDAMKELLKKHRNDSDYENRVHYYAERSIDIITRTNYKYVDENIKMNPDFQMYYYLVQELPLDQYKMYYSLKAFFEKNYTKSKKLLFEALDAIKDEVSQWKIEDFTYIFLVTYKSGFPGLWDAVLDFLSKNSASNEVCEFCKAVPVIYSSTDTEEIKSTLIHALDISKGNIVIKELLGYVHYTESEWGNAVAYFEQIEAPYIFMIEDIHSMMGWCYGKLKETKNEIEAYEQSYKEYPDGFSTLNNLGYAYYKAKQYNKALETFKECLDKNREVKFAANNYVRTLIAMQRFKDAKNFIAGTDYKIQKALKDRVAKADSTNKRVKKEPEIIEVSLAENDSDTTDAKSIDIGIKNQQFSQEKILEDELTARIEAGVEVFGKQLKIYRRKGEYGRQYILPTGKRLDLLTEDKDGNLFIIELKKDSGYDDAYNQTAEYLDWFEENWKDDVEINGIICLNNPSKDLLEKVHKDKRMRVFEYQISYTER